MQGNDLPEVTEPSTPELGFAGVRIFQSLDAASPDFQKGCTKAGERSSGWICSFRERAPRAGHTQKGSRTPVALKGLRWI